MNNTSAAKIAWSRNLVHYQAIIFQNHSSEIIVPCETIVNSYGDPDPAISNGRVVAHLHATPLCANLLRVILFWEFTILFDPKKKIPCQNWFNYNFRQN